MLSHTIHCVFLNTIAVGFLALACGETFIFRWHVENSYFADSSNAFHATVFGTEGTYGPILLNPEGNTMSMGETVEISIKTEVRIGSIKQLYTWKDPDDGLRVTSFEVIDACWYPRRWTWDVNSWYDYDWWLGRTNDKSLVSNVPTFTMTRGKYGPQMQNTRLTTAIIASTTLTRCAAVSCSLQCARTPGCSAFNLGKLPQGSCVCETLNVAIPLSPVYTSFLENNPEFTYYEQKIIQN